jgi:hypothetical protein
VRCEEEEEEEEEAAYRTDAVQFAKDGRRDDVQIAILAAAGVDCDE